MKQLKPEWQLADDGKSIAREWKFRNFFRTMSFVNAVAHIANAEDHHPDLEVGYGYCRIRYTTHAIGGLSENDFICAAKIDALPRRALTLQPIQHAERQHRRRRLRSATSIRRRRRASAETPAAPTSGRAQSNCAPAPHSVVDSESKLAEFELPLNDVVSFAVRKQDPRAQRYSSQLLATAAGCRARPAQDPSVSSSRSKSSACRRPGSASTHDAVVRSRASRGSR